MHIIEIARAGVISDAPSISSVGINVLNFLLSVVEIIAIISLVISGIIYLTAIDDKNRMQMAKRSLMYSIVGIMLGLGGMILVWVVGQFFQ
ncbi:MAG TPA: hypothetical protein DEA43_02955 [Candidatus Moranbacteria bacterium]|nr:hypothetical protein [Candidatus Moranbacteria bacterium]HBT45814.1 hypothetical protein [Candidatus Moranbacteria bacterium]